MKNCVYFKIIFALILFGVNINCNASENFSLVKDTIVPKKHSNKRAAILKSTSTAPEIYAKPNTNPYCPGSFAKIVSEATLFDTSNVISEIYIQISNGYVSGQDQLSTSNPSSHSKIGFDTFDGTTGKLRLYRLGATTTLADFKAAIEDVVFYNSSSSPSGNRKFSINIGNANYLPSTQHYYEFIPSTAISWTAAKLAAESKNYYGLQGYLATVTSMDEVQITGEQASGSGWIGGSDEAVDDVWRWVTGPENGTIFWNGKATGSPSNFAYWNSGEPNDYASSGEKYAHITAPGIGIKGSWNDMTLSGDNSGSTVNGVVAAYQSKGYAIEYGGMPGDPVINISAVTELTMSEIYIPVPNSICGSGTVTMEAISTETINWYEAPTGGVSLKTDISFVTPTLTINTTYYVDYGCSNRIPIIVIVNTIPTITSTNTPVSRCGSGTASLQANSTSGIINWYATATGTTIEGIGTSYTIPNIATSTIYYAEAFNNGCSNGNRVPVDVLVYTPPVVVDQKVTKCKLSSVELDASLQGMLYLWSTGEKTQKITVLTSGIYSVVVTSPTPENCSSSKKITVLEYNIPEIDRIDVNETTVVIYLKKEEPYFEYSVDGINYQSSNVFFNVQSGLQAAYVREINLCSTVSQPFIVLIAPKFFTPNGDTYNDYWEVKGLINYPQAEVSIFDRYGKLISVLNATKSSWDGTFNKYPLPSDDYWYELKIDESKPKKSGHFSLKR